MKDSEVTSMFTCSSDLLCTFSVPGTLPAQGDGYGVEYRRWLQLLEMQRINELHLGLDSIVEKVLALNAAHPGSIP